MVGFFNRVILFTSDTLKDRLGWPVVLAEENLATVL